MIRSFGVNTHTTTIIGVGISNGLVALSGRLISQIRGFADNTMGVGMIVLGLASVIIGETIFGSRTVFIATFSVVIGSDRLPSGRRLGAPSRMAGRVRSETDYRCYRHCRADRSDAARSYKQRAMARSA